MDVSCLVHVAEGGTLFSKVWLDYFYAVHRAIAVTATRTTPGSRVYKEDMRALGIG